MDTQVPQMKRQLPQAIRRGNIAANRRLYRRLGLSLHLSFPAQVTMWSVILLLSLWCVAGIVAFSRGSISTPVLGLVWVAALVIQVRIARVIARPLWSFLSRSARALAWVAALGFLFWNVELVVSFLLGPRWFEGLRSLF